MAKLEIPGLRDKVCVITGGTGVIGKALVQCLAENGVHLAIIGRGESAAELAKEMTEKYAVGAMAIRANVLDREALEKGRAQISQQLGRVDFLINGAGGNAPEATTRAETLQPGGVLSEAFFGLSVEGFDKVFDLNFKGTLLPSLVFTQDMVLKQQGVVVNISSMNAYHPLTKIPAYSAAKAAVNNFTEWLAVHFAPSGIRVNGLAPGFSLPAKIGFSLWMKLLVSQVRVAKKLLKPHPWGAMVMSKSLPVHCFTCLAICRALLPALPFPSMVALMPTQGFK